MVFAREMCFQFASPSRQWTSFLAGASTAGYVYLYSFYYFFFKTKMYGLFQTAFYFGNMALFSIVLGIMCGEYYQHLDLANLI